MNNLSLVLGTNRCLRTKRRSLSIISFFFDIYAHTKAIQVFSLKGKKLELMEELGKGSQATVWKGIFMVFSISKR